MVTTYTGSSFRQRPATRLGWWAVGLGAAFLGLWTINTFVFMPTSGTAFNESLRQYFLPFYGIFMVLCGLTSGIIGLVAVLRKHERSWLVLLTLLPGAMMVILLLGEFLIPH
jgi:hypothetical protein